jgi:hypothetical protein
MNICATGLSDRSFKVVMPTGCRGLSSFTGSTLSPGCLRGRRSEKPTTTVRKRPVASSSSRRVMDGAATASRGGSRPTARKTPACSRCANLRRATEEAAEYHLCIAMNVSSMQRISVVSKSACIAVLQNPKDTRARTRLLVALSDLIDPAFQGEESTDHYAVQLISEVRVWAQIVRTRIELARNSTAPRSTSRIRYPALQLLQVLSDLQREFMRAGQETNVYHLHSRSEPGRVSA